MTEIAPPVPLSGRADQLFPVLTAAQIARVAEHAQARKLASGEVLLEAGEQAQRFFLLTVGRLEVVRPVGSQEELVAVHRPGQFTGETSMLSGRPSFVRIRSTEPGEALELNRQQMMALVQTDSELGEILMRAFILRRVEIIARGFGDAVLIGSNHSPGTLRIKEFLTRNSHPFSYVDLDGDADVQILLDQFHVSVDEIPVLICRGEAVLRNPTNERIADCLGFNESIDNVHVRDVVVIGAGPAGLAAAVYAASEGLDVLVLEASAPGGQAGSSSKIENYLGFPTGISGNELAARAYAQAQKFGAEVMIARGATRLACDRRPYSIELGNDTRVPARSVIIATGAQYRRLALENLSEFEGSGIYYGATYVESQYCSGEEVMVVGGGNSAGQAAVFLAQSARHVHLLVRGSGLEDSMSRYLIRRIEENPAITLHPHHEIVGLEGTDHLERVRWRDTRTSKEETCPVRHLFMMTGAVPTTRWLEGCLALDAKGFIRTGSDLSLEELTAARWPLSRPPHLLETSLPGVFAVGDVRQGSVKRVASAVGEGSIVISFVHQVLAEGG